MRRFSVAVVMCLSACSGSPNTSSQPQSTAKLSGKALDSSPECSVDPNSMLVITRTSVVDDPVRTQWTGSTGTLPDGAWNIGRLLSAVARSGQQDPGTFVQQWLSQLATENQPLAQQWPNDSSGKPDLTQAPVHLLAIANRLDLRNPAQGELGELRFVYGTIPTGTIPNPANTLLFENDVKVIVEFKVPNTFIGAQEWAVGWHGLGDSSLTADTFNSTLQNLTESVVEQAAPQLLRIRVVNNTVDQAWPFQQFQVNGQGSLAPTALNLTPDARWAGAGFPNGSADTAQDLSDFVSSNSQAILAGTYSMPDSLDGQPLLATTLAMPLDYGPQATGQSLRSWPLTGVDSRTAAIFNVNTCNGCHGVGGATATPIPSQVSNRMGAGVASQLSLFFTGSPDGQFNELARRSADMQQVLCGSAGNSAGPSIVMPQ